MDAHAIPEIDQRKKEIGFWKYVFETFVGKQSRKVAFGIWLEIIATTLLRGGFITSDHWMKCTVLSCCLIGFGTILDQILLTFGKLVAIFAADKIKSVFSKKIEQTQTETVTAQ